MEKSREHLEAETGLAPVATLGVVAVDLLLASSVMMKQSPCVLVRRELERGHVVLRTPKAAGLFPSFRAIFVPVTAQPSPSLLLRLNVNAMVFHGDMYRMVLPVRRRIHWGIGLFCFWALASFCLTRKVLWLCFRDAPRQHNMSHRRLGE